MTDSLRKKLVSVLTQVVALTLSETEVEGYPYAVYDLTSSPILDKDGVCAFAGETRIRIVSDSLTEADTIRAAMEAAIAAGMHDSVFYSRLDDTTKDCVDGIWTIELNYTLKQYADWVENNDENIE